MNVWALAQGWALWQRLAMMLPDTPHTAWERDRDISIAWRQKPGEALDTDPLVPVSPVRRDSIHAACQRLFDLHLR